MPINFSLQLVQHSQENRHQNFHFRKPISSSALSVNTRSRRRHQYDAFSNRNNQHFSAFRFVFEWKNLHERNARLLEQINDKIATDIHTCCALYKCQRCLLTFDNHFCTQTKHKRKAKYYYNGLWQFKLCVTFLFTLFIASFFLFKKHISVQ